MVSERRLYFTYRMSGFHVHKQFGKQRVLEKLHLKHSNKLHKGDETELNLHNTFGSTGTQ